MKYLITECDCNPNSFDKLGISPLGYAIDKKQLQILQYIISEYKCNSACSLKHCDILKKQCEEWDLLDFWKEISDFNMTPLQMASLQGDFQTVKVLCNYTDESLGVTQQEAWMAFEAACRSGNVDIIKYLITYLTNQCSEYASSFMFTSCVHGHLDIVKFLIDECGCDPHADDEGLTPLHGACTDTKHLVITR